MQKASAHRFIFLFCVLFLVGIGARSVLSFLPSLAVGVFISAVCAALLYKRCGIVLSLAACVLGIGIALARFEYAASVSGRPFLNGTVVFTGIVIEPPEVTLKSQKLLVSIPEHKGKALITANLSPLFSYGDEISVSCNKMKEPEPFGSFRYDLYLKKDGIFWTCSYPRMVKIRLGQGNFFKREIFKIKTGIIARVNTLFPEPHGSLLLGLIVGTRATLPKDLSAAFVADGLMHIIAISGYNISIIAGIIMRVGVYVRLSKRSLSLIMLACISCFVVITGAGASVVRAGLMAAIAIAAFFCGRSVTPLWLLLASAFFMVFLSPYALLYDAGLELSFAATIGVIYGAPLCIPLARRVFGSQKLGVFGNVLCEIIATTAGATILTLPLSAYHFGSISLVFLFSNALILWLIPLIMAAGFLTVVLSLISFPLAEFCAFMAALLLEYVIAVSLMLAKIPFSSVRVDFFPLLFVVASYGIIFLIFKRSASQRADLRKKISFPL